MTHHPIRELPDGTRVYHDGKRYKPLAPSERTYGVNKPDAPGAVRFYGKWFLPIQVLPDDQRPLMPRTRPDSVAYGHITKPRRCKCNICKGPGGQRQRELAERHLRAGSFPDPAALHR